MINPVKIDKSEIFTTPEIAIVVAVAKNGIIGGDNQLPWHLPADLKHFKDLTMGHPIIMGRKTYESIGRPLPGRHNIIITRSTDFNVPGCTIVHSMEQAIEVAKRDNPNRICIIGGGQIFQQALPITTKIYLTEIETEPEGNVYFLYNKSDWREISKENHTANDRNQHDYNFIELIRV
jgi:dihydrofolate reductase